MVGEVVAEPAPELGLPTLSGYENHQGATILGPAATPLGRVVSGAGNADGRTEGAIAGRVVGTYLHGPVLARNPAHADLVLSWVVPDLPPLDDSEVDALRKERLSRRHRFRRAR
jgi:CobQ-like glutamine amidotransferase family enzyme